MGTPDNPTFGALLRHYRLQAGLTQEALAERARLSRRAIAALEQGINRAPRAATLALLSEALALSTQSRAALAGATRPDRRKAPPAAAAGSGAPPLGRARARACVAGPPPGWGGAAPAAPGR